MDNINDIISSLTDDDIDMLKSVASSILGSEKQKKSEGKGAGAKGNTKEVQSVDPSPVNALASGLNLDNIDFDMIMKAKRIFDKMNNTPNKNVDLILALKPHLRPETQNKADQALRILKLFEVLPLLRELF